MQASLEMMRFKNNYCLKIPTLKVRTECRRRYTNALNIKKDEKLKKSQDDDVPSTSRTLRGSVTSFSFIDTSRRLKDKL